MLVVVRRAHPVVVVAEHRVRGEDARDDERDQRQEPEPLHHQIRRIDGDVVGSELRDAERESEEEENQRGGEEGGLPGLVPPLEENDFFQHEERAEK